MPGKCNCGLIDAVGPHKYVIKVAAMIGVPSHRCAAALCACLFCMSILSPAADAKIETIDMPLISFVSGQDRAGRETIGHMATDPERDRALGNLLRSLIDRNEEAASGHGSAGKFKITAISHKKQRFLAVTDALDADQGPTIILNPDDGAGR